MMRYMISDDVKSVVLGWCKKVAEGWSEAERKTRKENGQWTKASTNWNV